MDLSEERPSWQASGGAVLALVSAAFGGVFGYAQTLAQASDIPSDGFVGILKGILARMPPWAWTAFLLALLGGIHVWVSHRYALRCWQQVQHAKKAYEANPNVRAWRALEAHIETYSGVTFSAAELLLLIADEMAAGFEAEALIEHLAQKKPCEGYGAALAFWPLLAHLQSVRIARTRRSQEVVGSYVKPTVYVELQPRSAPIIEVGRAEAALLAKRAARAGTGVSKSP